MYKPYLLGGTDSKTGQGVERRSGGKRRARRRGRRMSGVREKQWGRGRGREEE